MRLPSPLVLNLRGNLQYRRRSATVNHSAENFSGLAGRPWPLSSAPILDTRLTQKIHPCQTIFPQSILHFLSPPMAQLCPFNNQQFAPQPADLLHIASSYKPNTCASNNTYSTLLRRNTSALPEGSAFPFYLGSNSDCAQAVCAILCMIVFLPQWVCRKTFPTQQIVPTLDAAGQVNRG